MTTEQAALKALTAFRLEERHQEAVDQMSTRKWRAPMRLIEYSGDSNCLGLTQGE